MPITPNQIRASLFEKKWEKATGFDGKYWWSCMLNAPTPDEVQHCIKQFHYIATEIGIPYKVSCPREDSAETLLIFTVRLSAQEYRAKIVPHLPPAPTPILPGTLARTSSDHSPAFS